MAYCQPSSVCLTQFCLFTSALMRCRHRENIYEVQHKSTLQLITSKTLQLPNTSTLQLTTSKYTNSKTHELIKSPTQKPSTHNLKILNFILQSCSKFFSVLARIQVKKWSNYHHFQSFTSVILSRLKKRTCILHHLAFLVWLPAHYFLRPITHFLAPKSHFLTAILPYLAMFLTDLKGFVYTIAVYIYAFRIAFSSILHCVQHQNALRLAPKCAAFCTKTPCVQHQNVRCLAPKRTTFSSKRPKNWYKWRLF